MKKRVAILDLGTNTFNLLIADVKEDKSFEAVYRAEEFVKMGEDGLDRIGDKPFQRGVAQIRKYKEVIDQFHPQQVFAFGTAAIRRASNGDEFIREIKKICPMEVRKISGDEEAELIYLGVRQAVKLGDQPVLIMDIGGGSTEFIFADEKQIHWKQSFPVGASVLKQRFHIQEPISHEETNHLREYLNLELQPLISSYSDFKVTHLVGASGSFDTFASMVAYQFYSPNILEGKTSFEISPEQFHFINEKLLTNDLQRRLAMKGMIAFRAEMIVVAGILTEFVMEKFGIQQITQSAYALKEGVLWKMIQNEKV